VGSNDNTQIPSEHDIEKTRGACTQLKADSYVVNFRIDLSNEDFDWANHGNI